MVGAFAFLNGFAYLLLLFGVDDDPTTKLFDLNVALGTAIVTLTLGGFLVYQAASALGDVGSTALRARNLLPLLLLFPPLVAIGQYQVNHPERLPWVFPFVNVGIVAIPSLVIATVSARRYMRFNQFAWPVSWREWTSGIIYGAIGATTPAGIINTLYVVFGGALAVAIWGDGDGFNDLQDTLRTLPKGVGIAFDLSVISVVAPINEEFWKGMLVGFFFFRRGGVARCFLWGILAGAGFNVLETFENSLNIISPRYVQERTFGDQWWLFAVARFGTGTIHSAATGLSALGFYGIFRRRGRFAICLFLGMTVHGSWNFLSYVISGDAFFSGAGPDTTALDWLGTAGLIILFAACATMLWEMPRRLRDREPAPVYGMLGMLPAAGAGPLASSVNYSLSPRTGEGQEGGPGAAPPPTEPRAPSPGL